MNHERYDWREFVVIIEHVTILYWKLMWEIVILSQCVTKTCEHEKNKQHWEFALA